MLSNCPSGEGTLEIPPQTFYGSAWTNAFQAQWIVALAG
jgi:hypothetical protein